MSGKKRTEFSRFLAEQIADICDERGLSADDASGRGQAFEIWLARVMADADPEFAGIDVDEVCSRGGDLGVDLYMEDAADQKVRIVQASYAGKKVPEDKILAFFARHSDYLDPDWSRKYGNEISSEALLDFRDSVDKGWSVEYWFVTNTDVPGRIVDSVRARNEHYEETDQKVECRLLGATELRQLFRTAESREDGIPSSVELDLPSDQFLHMPNKSHETLLAVVKGNALVSLYKQHKQALFALNIRGYLGATNATNKSMKQTAETRPEDFYYFNNGISAICTGFQVDGNKLRATKLQIINGAQTLATLKAATRNPDLEVLFRLTCTQATATERGFNQDIIRFNNTQNVIKVSDFRANDPIQKFLKEEFRASREKGPLPRFHYLPKRSVGRKQNATGRGVRLEDLAKLRYAYLYEPTAVHASPRDLWTLAEDNGLYEKAFGVDGELSEVWSRATQNHARLALALFWRIDKETKDHKEKYPFLNRLKYHLLSLAGGDLREKSNADDYLAARAFDEYFSAFKKNAFKSVAMIGAEYLHPTGDREAISVFALVRSGKAWEQMSASYRRDRDAEFEFA